MKLEPKFEAVMGNLYYDNQQTPVACFLPGNSNIGNITLAQLFANVMNAYVNGTKNGEESLVMRVNAISKAFDGIMLRLARMENNQTAVNTIIGKAHGEQS